MAQKTDEKKTTKRRGRPRKKTSTAKPQEKKVVEEKEVEVVEKLGEDVYNHLRFQRCTKSLCEASYPAFMKGRLVCGGLMNGLKTTDGGKYKHYKCDTCGDIKKVEGEKV